jgi:hypothetical protein
MSVLGDIFKEANVSDDKIKEIVEKLRENPLDALAAVQALNLDQEVIGKIMGTVMSNPNAIDELAKEMGVSQEDIDKIKDQINNPPSLGED